MPLTRRRDLITRTIDGEVVILDGPTGNVHQLNATASYIWNKCDGARSPAEVAADVAARFEAVPDTVLADVLAVFLQFQRFGLLVEEGGEVRTGMLDDRKRLAIPNQSVDNRSPDRTLVRAVDGCSCPP